MKVDDRMMKRKVLSIFFVVAVVFIITACTQQNNDSNEINESKQQNVTLYSLTGTMQIDVADVEDYLANGWYTEPVVTMYAADGRTRVTLQSEIEAYKGVGWYTEPVVTMYAADGRTRITLESEVEAYKGVGWYTEPVVMMYALDGRTRFTLKSEVEAYKNVGWYLPYELSDDKKAVIRAMLWGVGNSPVGEISNVSSTFLVDSILDTSQAEYNSHNAADMVNYSKVDLFYKITSQEMIKAMELMYGRKMDYHIPTKNIENNSGSDYTYMFPNGRGKYGEIIINFICGEDTEFLVNYTYNRYNTAEHSLNRIADTATNLIAKFSSNNNESYPFCLKSIYDVNGNFKSMKRIYPDSPTKQKILSQYFVQYSPQDYYAERFKFNDDGTVQIVGVSLYENNQKYYESEMGYYEIKNDNSIEISVFEYGKHRQYTSFKYDKGGDYFYDYEDLVYEGETYSPEPYVVLPVDPNEKGILYRRKVFTYSYEPTFDVMSVDWNNCGFRIY